MYDTADEIIDGLGGTGGLADALGLSASTVSSWRSRGLPPDRWLEIVSLATARGLNGITLEGLAEMRARPNSVEPAEAHT